MTNTLPCRDPLLAVQVEETPEDPMAPYKCSIQVNFYPEDGYSVYTRTVTVNGVDTVTTHQVTDDHWEFEVPVGATYGASVRVTNGSPFDGRAAIAPIVHPTPPPPPAPFVPVANPNPYFEPVPAKPAYGQVWGNGAYMHVNVNWDAAHISFTQADEDRYRVPGITYWLDGYGTQGHLYDKGADAGPAVHWTTGEFKVPVVDDSYQYPPPNAGNPVRSARGRAANWGRVYDSFQSVGVPTTLNMLIDDVHYEIPNIWFAAHANTITPAFPIGCLFSNWKDYAPFYPNAADQQMSVYGYRSGDHTRPVQIQFSTIVGKTDAQGKPAAYVVTAKVLWDIPLSSTEIIGAFQPEFNYRLAALRDSIGWMMTMQPDNVDGCAGWVGHTGIDWTEVLSDKDGYHVDWGHDPLVWFSDTPTTGVGGSVKDCFLVDVTSTNTEAEYTQEFTVANGMDNTQTVKTNDYSHATTETWTWSWGFKWGMNQKITLKIETQNTLKVPFTEVDMKFTFQFEYGFTQEWNEQTTHTQTDTKTFTMGGQAVSLPSKSAAKIQAMLLRCSGTGTMGQAASLTEVPNVEIRGQIKNVNYSGWEKEMRAGVVDLPQVIKPLGMSTVHNGYKGEDGVQHEGAFVFPTLSFATSVGAAGSVAVTPIPYADPHPPKGAEMLPMQIGGSTQG